MGKIILAGNPNCGKTAIFNLLTGLNQQVSNFAGTTVEVNKGRTRIGERDFALIDLPGAYSIYPSSKDEEVAIDFLQTNKAEIDLIVFVADKNQIYRNSLFFSQLTLLNLPIILVINMWDLEKANNLDSEKLHIKLGVDVIPFSAKTPYKYQDLKQSIGAAISAKKCCTVFINPKFLDMESLLNKRKEEKQVERSNHTLFLYQKTAKIFADVNQHRRNFGKSKTYKIDRIIMHPFYGFLFFGVIMFFLFQLLFSFAEFPMNVIDAFFGNLTSMADQWLTDENVFKGIIVNGILPGLGGVFIFVPQIVLLFLILGILEDTGYLSRMSVLLDNSLKRVGLNGKSIIPLIGGFACAIPAIMSARTIKNDKERLITIMITPLIACSARLPVYTVLISLLFVPEGTGWIDQRGMLFFIMYCLGIAVALFVAWVFSKLLKSKSEDIMVIELPSYRVPIFSNIIKNTYHKTSQFVKGAGVIIFFIAIVLWVLTSYGPAAEMKSIEKQYAQAGLNDSMIGEKKAALLKASYAGMLGKIIEPSIAPLGYDWKIGIALISSFAAREVFIATISTIYALENDSDDLIVQRLRNAERENGTPVYTKGTIISLLLFYAFALQCASTIAVMRRETGGWKWPAIQFIYMGLLAYFSAFFAFQIFG